jgi:sugar phosphate isomerase/epimerase
MRFGAMNFPIIPVVEEIDTFAKLGFDYLELAMDPPMAHFTQLVKAKAQITDALSKKRLGLVCHLPTFVHTADLTDRIRRASLDEMRDSLETAVALGAEKIVFHPGLIRGMGSHVMSTAKRLAMESIAEIVAAADHASVTLCIENMFPAYGAFFEVDEYTAIFHRFPQLKMTLDTGHANIRSNRGSRLMAFFDRFTDRIAHIHLSDNSGKSDEHLPLGSGTVDFKGLARRMAAIGYDGTVTFEVFDADRRRMVESRRRFQRMFSHP